MSNSHPAPSHPAPAFVPFPDDGSGYDTDVVVVGLGPAGGVAAVALATYGVRVHAVTMFLGRELTPGAHHQPARGRGAARPGRGERRPQAGHALGPDGRHHVHHQPGRRGDPPPADVGYR